MTLIPRQPTFKYRIRWSQRSCYRNAWNFARQMLNRGDGYFVHRGETLLGIGMASGERIDAVVSAQPGAGQEVVLALNHALSGERITLEVASANERAVRLYERLGFLKTVEISVWYRVFPADVS